MNVKFINNCLEDLITTSYFSHYLIFFLPDWPFIKIQPNELSQFLIGLKHKFVEFLTDCSNIRF